MVTSYTNTIKQKLKTDFKVFFCCEIDLIYQITANADTGVKRTTDLGIDNMEYLVWNKC